MNIGEVWRLNSGGPWMTLTANGNGTAYFQYFDEKQESRSYQFYYGATEYKFRQCFTKRDLGPAAIGVDSKGKVEYCDRNGGCVCGGDLPSVRAGCSNWKTLPTTEIRR